MWPAAWKKPIWQRPSNMDATLEYGTRLPRQPAMAKTMIRKRVSWLVRGFAEMAS